MKSPIENNGTAALSMQSTHAHTHTEERRKKKDDEHQVLLFDAQQNCKCIVIKLEVYKIHMLVILNLLQIKT